VTFGLHWVRRRQRDLTKVVLALFCLAWLQASAMPCAMADGAQSAMSPPMASQASTVADPATHDCQYCPPPQAGHSTDDQPAACSYPHGPQVDGRAAVGWMFAAPVVTEFAVFVAPASDALVLPQPRAPLPRAPLSVRYCRFIE
jgi:hypothetical protein